MRRIEKAGQGRFFKLKQHIVCLDFGALAVQRFHLKRSGVVSQDGADFKAAIFFKKNVHKAARCERGAECSRFAGAGEP